MTVKRNPINPSWAKRFIFAGKAFITVRDKVSGNFEDYKIKLSADKHFWYVSAKKADGWVYLGKINPHFTWCLIHTYKSQVKETDRSFWVFELILKTAHNYAPLPTSVEIFHNGVCGRCGRRLTDDDSVARGFGSHCWKIVNVIA